MAEAGAHLTSTAADDRPSVFQVLAQDSLMEAVRPALKHAVKVLAESSPCRYGFLLRRFDEIYLLLDLLVQNHFLNRTNASFSENFYSLKRVSTSRHHGLDQGLSRTSRWLSLLLLCLVPYLRAKLEQAVSRQREEAEFCIRLPRSRAQKLCRALLAVSPYVSMAGDGWLFCQQLLYVFGRTGTHSPLLWLAGVRLTQLTAQDLRKMEFKPRDAHTAGLSVIQRMRSVASRLVGGLAVSVSTSLSLGVFFLQFLDWWFSSENQVAVKALTSLPTPPPPTHLQDRPLTDRCRGAGPVLPGTEPEAVSTSGGAGKRCPLCRKVRSNDTVLATSGLVFCYGCIYVYVKANQRCPMTGYPTELQHLIKIYSPDG